MFQEIFNKRPKNENHGVYKLEKTPALCLISVINCSKNPSKKSLLKKSTDFFFDEYKYLLKQMTENLKNFPCRGSSKTSNCKLKLAWAYLVK